MIQSQYKHSISFYTLGCRLNQSETAVIQNSFELEGFRLVDFNEPADIVVVNTCTVTENGDADTRKVVNKINRLNPRSRIALIGCQAQIQKEKLAELPNVTWVVGNARKMELPQIFKKDMAPASPQVITPTINRSSFTIPIAGVDRQHTRANLKIQDGCDFFCSFCEIPYARGRARSREFNDILKEAKTLADAGHKELVITGINVGTYNHQGKSLIDIIRALDDINGIKRIRLSSVEPTTIPADLFDLMAGSSKLCRYLHIPLQSGHDRILRDMKRKYTLKEFDAFVKSAKKRVQGICIGTDVIVGFPGEDEESFQATYEYLLDAPIHYFHVFSYSVRSLAKSRQLGKSVPQPAIQSRSQRLRELSQRKRRIYYESMLNTCQPVLFEQQKEGVWTGLTDNYIRVKVPCEQSLANTIHLVEFNRYTDNTLTGTLTNAHV